MPRRSKSALVGELIRTFRASANQDLAFETLAAERLGINPTDLHCLNIIENGGGLAAGELASAAGLTAGAVTGVIDRLEKAGFARRLADPSDRRRVRIEVTPSFYARSESIWGPLAADWHQTIGERFTSEELERISKFLHTTNELGRRNLARLREMGDHRHKRRKA